MRTRAPKEGATGRPSPCSQLSPRKARLKGAAWGSGARERRTRGAAALSWPSGAALLFTAMAALPWWPSEQAPEVRGSDVLPTWQRASQVAVSCLVGGDSWSAAWHSLVCVEAEELHLHFRIALFGFLAGVCFFPVLDVLRLSQLAWRRAIVSWERHLSVHWPARP